MSRRRHSERLRRKRDRVFKLPTRDEQRAEMGGVDSDDDNDLIQGDVARDLHVVHKANVNNFIREASSYNAEYADPTAEMNDFIVYGDGDDSSNQGSDSESSINQRSTIEETDSSDSSSEAEERAAMPVGPHQTAAGLKRRNRIHDSDLEGDSSSSSDGTGSTDESDSTDSDGEDHAPIRAPPRKRHRALDDDSDVDQAPANTEKTKKENISDSETDDDDEEDGYELPTPLRRSRRALTADQQTAFSTLIAQRSDKRNRQRGIFAEKMQHEKKGAAPRFKERGGKEANQEEDDEDAEIEDTSSDEEVVIKNIRSQCMRIEEDEEEELGYDQYRRYPRSRRW